MSKRSARELGEFLGILLREPTKVQNAQNQARREVVGTVLQTVAVARGIKDGLTAIGFGTDDEAWSKVGAGLDEAMAADKARIRQIADKEHATEVAQKLANRDRDEAVRQRSFFGVAVRGMTDQQVLDYAAEQKKRDRENASDYL